MTSRSARPLQWMILFVSAALLPAACDPTASGTIQPSGARSVSTGAAAPEDQNWRKRWDGLRLASSPGNSAYQIGAQDVLEIVVFKVPELTRSVRWPMRNRSPAADRRGSRGGVDFAGVGAGPYPASWRELPKKPTSQCLCLKNITVSA